MQAIPATARISVFPEIRKFGEFPELRPISLSDLRSVVDGKPSFGNASYVGVRGCDGTFDVFVGSGAGFSTGFPPRNGFAAASSIPLPPPTESLAEQRDCGPASEPRHQRTATACDSRRVEFEP